MSAINEKPLSTTALAKSVGKEPRELFVLLADKGWIEKHDDKWRLTPKGEFEGGSYARSEKYGEYIVWPATTSQHQVFALLPVAPLTATHLGRKLGLSARMCNLLLAELGWISHYLRGWQLTEAGKGIGGQQQENERNGVPYVSWPETLMDSDLLQQRAGQLLGEGQARGVEDHWLALDGHRLRTKEELLIDNWLYLNAVVHSTDHPLPFDSEGTAEFYLPNGQIYIEYWGFDKTPAYLKSKLARQKFYEEHELPLIELSVDDLNHLDDVLPRALLKVGVLV